MTVINVLDTPPPASAQLAPAAVKAFQRAQAEHVNRVPARRRYIDERNAKYLRRFADDEHDSPEEARLR